MGTQTKGAATLAIFTSTFSDFVVDFPKKSFCTLVVTCVLLHTVVVVVKTCKQTTSAVTSKSDDLKCVLSMM